MHSKQQANAWSNYWEKGYLTTFVGGKDNENYSGAVKKYWNTIFETMQNKGTIVDLCAGNGAILALANEFSKTNNRLFNMIAVDYADSIATGEFYTANPNIKVLQNTSISQTGLENNSVDLCTSQFGFEYTDSILSCKEINRILKPEGKFCALMHHSSSYIALHSQSAVEQVVLCDRSKLTKVTTKLLSTLDQKLSTDKGNQAALLKEDFNKIASRLQQYGSRLLDDHQITYFLNELANLFGRQAKHLSFKEKIKIVDQLEADSKNYHTRMKAMVDACQSKNRIYSLVTTFENEGFIVKKPIELQRDGSFFAWVFEATKYE